jgi:primosomal protein N' (replication factor Y)
VPADELPIARVAVDIPLAHLDRPFDYQVSAAHATDARPGVRVRVRFAGRLVDGFVLARAQRSEHAGRLAFVERVVSPEPVLSPEVAALCRAVADRYAGTLADVLRLAVPPRNARAETPGDEPDAVAGPGADDPGADGPGEDGPAEPEPASAGPPADGVTLARVVVPDGWRAYQAGAAFLAAVAGHRPARAVWQALPGEDWPARLAEAAGRARAAGHGALLVVPDVRDLTRLETALGSVLPPGDFTVLSADLGPAERYRRFLAVRRGAVRVVAGTRAAAFAPVTDPALLALFDDGDDLHAERRAPYPHAREVLMLRSAREHAALLVAGFARTAEAQLLVESGWAAAIQADRGTVRRAMPRIDVAGDAATGADSAAARARIAPVAFDAARRALDAGLPVLVQVPRRGYVPGFACRRCDRPARCRRCSGPLALTGEGRAPTCRWCGIPALKWVCPACGHGHVRPMVIGSARTAEEIGRAFPGTRLRTSAGDRTVDAIPSQPSLVVATPGAEPATEGGYGAALLLDGAVMVGRADLRAAEEALRRWMAAATLVRPAGDGGRVVIGADGSLPTVAALTRWQPAEHAATELAARRELHFPPVAAMASLEGEEVAVAGAVAEFATHGTADVLGPVPLPGRPAPDMRGTAVGAGGRIGPDAAACTAGGGTGRVRALLRAPPGRRKELAAALHALAAARSARKEPQQVRIEVDPAEVG